jgi:hypothetical protein|tara:strand:- start:589 stop:834 length:246 start_codon:yes stop_codon:yes gene_type:complete
MSLIDPHSELQEQRQELRSFIDDWWCQVFALQIGCPMPSKDVGNKFIGFVEERMAEVDTWRITDDDLSKFFPEFLDSLGDW